MVPPESAHHFRAFRHAAADEGIWPEFVEAVEVPSFAQPVELSSSRRGLLPRGCALCICQRAENAPTHGVSDELRGTAHLSCSAHSESRRAAGRRPRAGAHAVEPGRMDGARAATGGPTSTLVID